MVKNLKITLGNKRLDDKPSSQQEMSSYFKDLRFKTGTFNLGTFKEMIDNGYTLTYIYKDQDFTRGNGYMKNNYVGTQFIVVDIDKCELSPEDFISRIKYKPTIYHTTFSNLTERKENMYCFHLIYVFDEMIYGEDNFHSTFNMITDDYKDYVDKCCLDCHRVMFTSNSSLPNYDYKEYDITYKVNDFIKESSYDNLNDFFKNTSLKEDCKESGSSIYSYSYNNICEKTKTLQGEESLPEDNIFNLDEDFRRDLFKMDRLQFIRNYERIYPYKVDTHVDETRYKDGYADLRNEEYYIVPSSTYRWNKEENKPYIPKVKIGFRTKMFLIDTLTFMKIFPNISKEHLVYLMVREVFHHFDNRDGQ